MTADSTKPSYKDTIFLPQTGFPMKAGLAAQEPKWLELWEELDLYQRLRETSRDKPKYILHDGPPYANDHIHVGTAMTKILKDACVRIQQMLGFDAHWTPGWDCHGLPIEWKIEEKYRKAGKNKDDVPVIQFRAECLAFAQHWVGVQMEEFKRTGAMADWQNPYVTTSRRAEHAIVKEVHKFLLNGGLYRGARPVMWSPVERTALAEAEVEYHEHNSPTAMVAFPITAAPNAPDLIGAKIVIWTTTPWTLPANRAIAYGDFEYTVLRVTGRIHDSPGPATSDLIDDRLIVASNLLKNVLDAGQISGHEIVATLSSSQLQGIVAAHPLRGQGYEFNVPLLPGDFVTTDAGTGFVHIAPSHGMDDYQLGLKHGLEMPELVLDDGSYAADVPLFAGLAILDEKGKHGPANKVVLDAIMKVDNLVATARITHSYPHSWRSKAPVIFRATPQWFISMETNDLRRKALAAIDDTNWFPPERINRIRGMIEQRPDWNISRQRTWGVPLCIYMHKQTFEPLRDSAVCQRIQDILKTEGSDCWFTRPDSDFLGPDYNPDDYTRIMDIVDIWFESGSTHAFVIEDDPEQQWPADMYWESSDQHRGWFQSSLLESCGTRGRAPYKNVVTNGFVNDAKGYKMSKSIGNVVAPEAVIKEYGADILRLWVFSQDYTEEMRIGPEIIKQTSELYRRLRNTLRYLLGALAGWDESERLDYDKLEELEQYMLHQLAILDGKLRAAIAAYDYTTMTALLHGFCNSELSSFYFDIRKDSLYCDATDSNRRRSCRTVMATLYSFLTAWLAPILCFTAEEAWQHGKELGLGASDAVPSVHLRMFPEVKTEWQNQSLADKWKALRDIRLQVTGALEKARADKLIGSALEAEVMITTDPEWEDIDWPELFIVSSVQYGAFPEAELAVDRAPGDKCERCWRVLEEVSINIEETAKPLCLRCEAVVA